MLIFHSHGLYCWLLCQTPFITHLLVHHNSSGTDRKRKHSALLFSGNIYFPKHFVFFAAGSVLPGCVFPPNLQSASSFFHLDVWPRCVNCVGFCCFILGGMMQSASKASLLTTRRRGYYTVQWHRSARCVPQSDVDCVFVSVCVWALWVLLSQKYIFKLLYENNSALISALNIHVFIHYFCPQVGLTQQFPGSFFAGVINKAATAWRWLLGAVFGCSYVGVSGGFNDGLAVMCDLWLCVYCVS